MVRRTDRPLLGVRVSFETTRFSPQHLIEIYDRLAPTPRRSLRPTREDAPQSPTPRAATGSGGRP
jgi:transcriptional regulator of nitric oxide reductase